ncbi:hypothetical protein [Streptomyces fumanus]|uniref:Uncharacterized protein n=1 Tax=Streptomyces fumanus TaxID=67302 RepID=A0A919ACR1_9ACTN|nr:hypothetical protein [Streptomyces fumanus]GHE99617.1 hypothetical protein GCM10018772_25050 [Streptomyces fumanus]
MPYEGPWPLLEEILQRDPGSREGHHRMRQFFQAHGMGAVARDYAFWLASGRPDNGELLMLPLHVLVDWYLEQHGDGRGGALQDEPVDPKRRPQLWPIPSTPAPLLAARH